MDFYVDLAVAVLLRLLKNKRDRVAYYRAIAKVYLAIELLEQTDQNFAKLVLEMESDTK